MKSTRTHHTRPERRQSVNALCRLGAAGGRILLLVHQSVLLAFCGQELDPLLPPSSLPDVDVGIHVEHREQRLHTKEQTQTGHAANKSLVDLADARRIAKSIERAMDWSSQRYALGAESGTLYCLVEGEVKHFMSGADFQDFYLSYVDCKERNYVLNGYMVFARIPKERTSITGALMVTGSVSTTCSIDMIVSGETLTGTICGHDVMLMDGNDHT